MDEPNQPGMPPRLLSARELADHLGLKGAGNQTVLRWKRGGIIPAAIDEPSVVRFDLAEVRKALAARAAEAVKHQFP